MSHGGVRSNSGLNFLSTKAWNRKAVTPYSLPVSTRFTCCLMSIRQRPRIPIFFSSFSDAGVVVVSFPDAGVVVVSFSDAGVVAVSFSDASVLLVRGGFLFVLFLVCVCV